MADNPYLDNPYLPASPPSAAAGNPYLTNPYMTATPKKNAGSHFKFETPAAPKGKAPVAPSVLRTVGDVMETPLALINAAGYDLLGADAPNDADSHLQKALSEPDPHALAEEYGMGTKASLDRDAAMGDPISAARLNNPYLNAGLTFMSEFANPSNAVAGSAFRLAGQGVRALRAASPAVDAAATGAERAANVVTAPVRKAVKDASDAVGGAVGNFFDRFHGVRKAGGPEFEAAARRKEATMVAHEREVNERTREIFGESDVSNAHHRSGGGETVYRYQNAQGDPQISFATSGTHYSRAGTKDDYRDVYGGTHKIERTYAPKNPLKVTDGLQPGYGAIRALDPDLYARLTGNLSTVENNAYVAQALKRFNVSSLEVKPGTEAATDRIGAELARAAGYDAIENEHEVHVLRPSATVSVESGAPSSTYENLVKNAKTAFRPVQGLTQAQKTEVGRLSILDEDGKPVHARNADIPEPAGKTLAERAKMLRADYYGITDELKDRGLFLKRVSKEPDRAGSTVNVPEVQAEVQARKATSAIYPSNEYLPMRRFNDRKRYTTDDLFDPDSDEVPTSLVKSAPTRTGSGFAVKKQGRFAKVRPNLAQVADEDLHPDFDLAHQYYHDMMDKRRSIAAVDSQRELNAVHGVDPKTGDPLQLRIPIPYRDPLTGAELGIGEEGYAAKTRIVNRVRKANALGTAVNDAVEAGITDPGIIGRRIQAASYVRGRMVGAGKSGRLLGGASNTLARTASKVEANPYLANAQKGTAQAAERAWATGDALREGQWAASELSGVLRGNVEGHKAAAAAHMAELTRLKEVAASKFRPTSSKAFNEYLLSEADRRGAKPAYTERFTDIKDAADNYDRTVRSSGNANRAYGYGGSSFTPDDVTAARKTFKEMRPNEPVPSTSAMLDMLHQAEANRHEAFSQAAYLRDNHQGVSIADAQATTRAKAADARAGLPAAKAREAGAKDAAAIAAPTTKQALAGTNTLAGKDLPKVNDLIGKGTARNVAAIRKAQASVDRSAETVKLEYDDLAERYVQARADTNAKAWIRSRASHVFQEQNKAYSIENEVQSDAVRVPHARRYEHEDPTLSTDSKYHVIEKSMAEYLRTNKGAAVPLDKDSLPFFHFMGLLNRLARIGIIAIPTTHVVWNMGTHFLTTGGSPLQMARIAAGKGLEGENAAFVDRLEKAGGSPNFQQRTFGGEDDAHVMTTAPSDLMRENQNIKGVANVVDQYASAKLWAPNQKLVFDQFEGGYAVDHFRRLVQGGMSDGEAARAVRKTYGDYGNISPSEAAARLTKLFYFYPWMKTLIPFWTKQGLINPKTWDAPVRAIQDNNQQQGYDDPSKPFTGTFGHRADGTFRRITLPLPQRILEPIGDVGRVPVDFARGDVDQSTRDLRSPLDYLAGHFNPAVSLGYDAWLDASGHGAPWQKFSDPNDPTDPRLQALGHVAGKIVTPSEWISRIGQDPIAGLGTMLMGGSSYGTAPKAMRDHQHAVKQMFGKLIELAEKSGNAAEVGKLKAAEARALAPKQ